VPLAVVLEALLRSPAWLSHAGSAVLTLVGGVVVLVGFFGINAAGEDDEKTRHAVWEERQEVGARGPARASHLLCLLACQPWFDLLALVALLLISPGPATGAGL
jgi:hypothetical protein